MNNIKKYISELDFLKGIFIMLMVLFHLVPFIQKYPELTKWVYCFHMSGFLIISGYLQDSSSKDKLIKSAKKILIPYVVFEVVYIIALGLLQDIVGSANRIDFSFTNVIYYVFLQPSGTYWYLHTLFICLISSYMVERFKINPYNKLILNTCILFVLSLLINGLNFDNIIYFIIGKMIQKSNFCFIDFIRPSFFAIMPIILISIYSNELQRGSLSGIVLTLSIMSFLMFIYKYINYKVIRVVEYLGRNTLSIVLFSPIYTVMTKFYLKLFGFDDTLILWALCSMLFVLIMCLISAWISDRILLSKYFFKGNLYHT